MITLEQNKLIAETYFKVLWDSENIAFSQVQCSGKPYLDDFDPTGKHFYETLSNLNEETRMHLDNALYHIMKPKKGFYEFSFLVVIMWIDSHKLEVINALIEILT